MSAEPSTSWTTEARRDLQQLRREVNQLLHKLVLQEATRDEIEQVKQMCDQYRERYSSNFQEYFDQREYHHYVITTQEDMIKKLTALEILEMEMTAELQTYPYSRPENVQDDFSPTVTTESRNVQNITTAHLYPHVVDNRVEESSGPVQTAMTDGSSPPCSPRPQRSTRFNGLPPTTTLYNLLFLARTFQSLRNAPTNRPDQQVPFNQLGNAAVGRMFWAFSYKLSPQSLLNKSPHDILQMINTGQLQ